MKQGGEEDLEVFEFMAILWSLWLLRNKKVFNTPEPTNPRIVFGWIKGWRGRWINTEVLEPITNKMEENSTLKRTNGNINNVSWRTNWLTEGQGTILIVDGAWKEGKNRDQGKYAAYG